MTHNSKKIWLSAIYIFALCALPAAVQAKPAQTGAHSAKRAPAPLCRTSEAHTSSISLQSSDNNRLKVARAFRAYLEKKGRDSGAVASIYKASLKSGVDFELLLLKAIMESDLGHYNVATGSTARGLFQYIEPTWLVLMKRYGANLGYAHYADAISFAGRTGIPYIKNKNKYLEAEILALRHDQDMSAMIKALQIQEETQTLRNYKKGRVSATDHYISHMLGLSLARELYDLRRKNSIIAVARLNKAAMREAARLNKPFFYDGKRALTAREVYAKFEARVGREFKNIYNIGNTKTTICTAAKVAR